MLETIGTILGVAAIGIVIWSVLWLVGRALAGARGEQTWGESKFAAKVVSDQMARTAELQNLAWQIKAAPEGECASLWRHYLTLEATHNEMTALERKTLVGMQTVIDDRTQWELDNSINPYDVPAEPRRVLKPGRARG